MSRQRNASPILLAALLASAGVSHAAQQAAPNETAHDRVEVLSPRDEQNVPSKRFHVVAHVNGRDIATYRMYWYVDEKNPIAMENEIGGKDFKAADIDFDKWHWDSTGTYRITFRADDLGGKYIDARSVVIHIAQ